MNQIDLLDHLTYKNDNLQQIPFKIAYFKAIKSQSNHTLVTQRFNMIEVKIKGPIKRTVINSLKCEILKDKDKFFLMRFKSLPLNKNNSRNLLWIDVPQTVKASLKNQACQYFKSSTTKKQNLRNVSELKQHKRLWTEQLEKSYLFAEHEYLSKSQFSTYEKEQG